MARVMTTAQKAMRLFAVLVAGAELVSPLGPDGEVAIFRGETRLHALMFWLRNPDYLAHELLDLAALKPDASLIGVVHRMLEDDEPILRRDGMAKWRHGAYEPIDDEMAILSSVGLVRTVMRHAGPRSAANDFLLLPGSLELAAELESNIAYNWYAERMRLVLLVAAGQRGSVLKKRQYQQIEYATTRGRHLIPSIAGRVAERLEAMTHGA
ncbi:hypothetical protein [Azospirillum formosense]|uniref:hypothetical protein n=1 Tax=Azospirillum formosense TaxID=861533 RepID=UPI00157A90F6|nr:hypothetical protein [Azospirillum formosense]MBY3755526.1 hypothetical protein [Azospirillum formosense]